MSRYDDDRHSGPSGPSGPGEGHEDPGHDPDYDRDYDRDYGPEDYDPDDYDEYDVAEDESPGYRRARSRRHKALITVGVLILGLFFAFWWAWSYYQASDSTASGTPTAKATCQPDGPSVIIPSKITVNVFNSTTRTGLAKSVSEELRAQGYVIAQVANDPLKKQVAGPAEVRFGPAGKARADLVMKSIGEGAVAVPDQRADEGVDIALGQAFVKIVPLPTPATSLPICPAPSGSPSPASPSPAAS